MLGHNFGCELEGRLPRTCQNCSRDRIMIRNQEKEERCCGLSFIRSRGRVGGHPATMSRNLWAHKVSSFLNTSILTLLSLRRVTGQLVRAPRAAVRRLHTLCGRSFAGVHRPQHRHFYRRYYFRISIGRLSYETCRAPQLMWPVRKLTNACTVSWQHVKT